MRDFLRNLVPFSNIAKDSNQFASIDAHGNLQGVGNEVLVEQPDPPRDQKEESDGLNIFSQIAVGPTFGHRDVAQWLIDRNEYVKHYSGSTYVAVGAVARKIAMQRAKVGVIIKSKAGETVEPLRRDHPLVRLFDQPNPEMTEFELWYSTVAWRLITGDSFLWKARNGFGVVTELWPMPSQWTHAIPDVHEYISGYKVRAVFGRTDAIIPRRDMLHMKEPTIDWTREGRFYGFPQLAAAATMVDLEESMLKRLFHQFKNFAPPGLHYSTDERLEEYEVKKLYQQIIGQHAAAEATGRPVITHSGMKMDDMTKQIREMDYSESIDTAMEYILAIFGVPKAVVGLVKDTNRANMQGALMSFCENTINPLLMAIGQALTLSLAHEYDERLVVWFDPCTVEDIEQMRKNIETANKQGAVTPNEIRDLLLSRGSFEEGGDVALINQSLVPAPFGNEESEIGDPVTGETDDSDPMEEELDPEDGKELPEDGIPDDVEPDDPGQEDDEELIQDSMEKREGPFEFSSTQFNIEGDLKDKILDLAGKIDDDDLAKDGREDEPHVTVLYGLHTERASDVEKVVEDFGSVDIELGEVRAFKKEDQEVLFVSVRSPRLRKLNSTLKKNLEFTSTHKGYTPHITLGYVKKGTADKYIGDKTLEGEIIEFSDLVYSPKSGTRSPKRKISIMSEDDFFDVDKRGDLREVVSPGGAHSTFFSMPDDQWMRSPSLVNGSINTNDER